MATPAAAQEPISALECERPVLGQAEQLLNGRSEEARPARLKLVGPAGEELELPESLITVLHRALPHLLRGNSVAVTPIRQELTTHEAADLLDVTSHTCCGCSTKGTSRSRRQNRTGAFAYLTSWYTRPDVMRNAVLRWTRWFA